MPDHIELEDLIESLLEREEKNQNESELESTVSE